MSDLQPVSPTSALPPPDDDALTAHDLRGAWNVLSRSDRMQALRALQRDHGEDVFFELTARDKAWFLLDLPAPERRSWIRLLEPRYVADLVAMPLSTWR